MTREQAEQFLIEFCKGKGSMNREKWVELVICAWKDGYLKGSNKMAASFVDALSQKESKNNS